MAAVKVSWDGLDRPLIVPWRNAESFETMMSAIQSAKEQAGGDLEVVVRCMPRG